MADSETSTGVTGKPVTERDFNLLMSLTIGILTVVGITFITLIIQYFTATQASYQALVGEINKQTGNVQLMTNLLLEEEQRTQQINFKLQ